MQIDRIYYPIKTLGPGNRIGIWTVGCHHKCLNCSNPELWERNPDKEISLDKVFALIESVKIHNSDISGVTISGGEPFLQPNELSELVLYIRKHVTDDLLVYTGFTLKELQNNEQPSIQVVLDNIAVLIDGRYMEELNDNSALCGSSNQQIHLLNDKFTHAYETIQNTDRTVQNVYFGKTSISFGIPNKNYRKTIHDGLREKGVLVGGK